MGNLVVCNCVENSVRLKKKESAAANPFLSYSKEQVFTAYKDQLGMEWQQCHLMFHHQGH